MSRLRLKLPATSANLGPGFDALAVALRLYLEIEAEPADVFSIQASGRNAELCSAMKDNLLVRCYTELLLASGRKPLPLRIRMNNQIPLGMGCGSSAAVRLAAVALASFFGEMHWSKERVLAEAVRMEGHPDNIAACWLGGFVASAVQDGEVRALSMALPTQWKAVLVLPDRPLATTASRAVLPEMYTRRDVVANIQSVALLTAAFAQGRADLIAAGMRDWLHQPYREHVCGLLPKLLPLSGRDGILGAALSGAGPTVLLITESAEAAERARSAVAQALQDFEGYELLTLGFEPSRAQVEIGQ